MYILTNILNNKIKYQTISTSEDEIDRLFISMINDLKNNTMCNIVNEEVRFCEFRDGVNNGSIEIRNKPISI